MMRRSLSLLPLLFLFTVAAKCTPGGTTPPPQPNLSWDGPKIYSTGSVGVPLAGFGVNAMVDVLPGGPLPMTVGITKTLKNTGAAQAAAGYVVTDTVQAMRFAAVVGGTAGFLPVSGPPVAALRSIGPALAAGDSTDASFGFTVNACGLYRETLSADVSGAVAESNEGDNRAEHWFLVPGTQTLGIAVAPNADVNLWHGPPPMPNFTRALPALPFTAYTFTITAPPGTTFTYHYYQGLINGVYGAVAKLVGPAPSPTPVAGPISIQLQLLSVKTHGVPTNDILTDLGREQLSGKVTAITADGCFMRQRQASFFVWHPSGSP